MRSLLLFLVFLAQVFAGFYVPEHCDQTIDKRVYKVCYNYKAKGARAVWYRAEGDKVFRKNIKKRPRFYSEKTIPSRYRTKPSDYSWTVGLTDCKGIGCKDIFYNRGHLAPDADFDYSYSDLRKVYSMANIVPQIDVVNQKLWEKAEEHERLTAKQLGYVDVTNIVIYKEPNRILVKKPLEAIPEAKNWDNSKKLKYLKKAKALMKKRILVPTAFVKVLENEEKNFKQCLLYFNRYPEGDPEKDLLYSHAIDCNKLKGYKHVNR